MTGDKEAKRAGRKKPSRRPLPRAISYMEWIDVGPTNISFSDEMIAGCLIDLGIANPDNQSDQFLYLRARLTDLGRNQKYAMQFSGGRRKLEKAACAEIAHHATALLGALRSVDQKFTYELFLEANEARPDPVDPDRARIDLWFDSDLVDIQNAALRRARAKLKTGQPRDYWFESLLFNLHAFATKLVGKPVAVSFSRVAIAGDKEGRVLHVPGGPFGRFVQRVVPILYPEYRLEQLVTQLRQLGRMIRHQARNGH